MADKQRKEGKLNPAWCGPYIIRYHEKDVYQLSNEAGNVIQKKVTVARLKLYSKRAANGPEEERKGKEKKRKA